MLARRIASAVVFCAGYGLILFGRWSWCDWAVVAVGIAVGIWCLSELAALARKAGIQLTQWAAFAVVVLAPCAWLQPQLCQPRWGIPNTPDGARWISWIAVMIWLLGPLWTQLGRGPRGAFESIAATFWATAYVVFPIVMLMQMRIWQDGPWLVLFIFMVTWLNDTGAFFAGRKWGRHPMAPKLSPGKTWEGCLGGLVASVLGAMALGLIQKVWPAPDQSIFFGRDGHSLLPCAVLAVCLVATGWLGDLAESLLKREAHIKDSGPDWTGHGGILDVIDSLFVNTPITYIMLLAWYGPGITG